MWFDADFSFSKHIQKTCKACFLQIHDLGQIRQYLTHEVAVFVANALVSVISVLTLCLVVCHVLLNKLQSIQNTLTRLVTNHRKYAHVILILK